jgi:hypothetical protein
MEYFLSGIVSMIFILSFNIRKVLYVAFSTSSFVRTDLIYYIPYLHMENMPVIAKAQI